MVVVAGSLKSRWRGSLVHTSFGLVHTQPRKKQKKKLFIDTFHCLFSSPPTSLTRNTAGREPIHGGLFAEKFGKEILNAAYLRAALPTLTDTLFTSACLICKRRRRNQTLGLNKTSCPPAIPVCDSTPNTTWAIRGYHLSNLHKLKNDQQRAKSCTATGWVGLCLLYHRGFLPVGGIPVGWYDGRSEVGIGFSRRLTRCTLLTLGIAILGRSQMLFLI